MRRAGFPGRLLTGGFSRPPGEPRTDGPGLAWPSNAALTVLHEFLRGFEPDAQPLRGSGVEVDPMRSHSDFPLTPALLSSHQEEKGPSLGCLEANCVVVCPPEAGGGTSIKLAGHIVDVGHLDDPCGVVSE